MKTRKFIWVLCPNCSNEIKIMIKRKSDDIKCKKCGTIDGQHWFQDRDDDIDYEN